MKICFLADSESIHTKRWCAHFHALGHEVHLISFKPIPVENIHFHYIDAGKIDVKGGNWKTILKFRKIKKLLSKIKPDILHAHYATSYGLVGALSGFKPYVVTALGTDILLSPKKSFIYRKIIRYVLRRANVFTLMADHMTNIISELKLGDINKCKVVPFGIDTQIFNAQKRNVSEELFTITSTRNFENVYNLPHLIKAVAKVKDKLGNFKLNLIGDGSKRIEIEDLIAKENLKSNTEFFGRISQPEISDVLQKSNLFITVSLSDGNNISLNEAMACGPICIASRIAANEQWIKHNENGFLVEINDVDELAFLILKAKKEYHLLSEKMLILNAEIIKEKADWNLNMNKVESIYQNLCRK